MFSKSFKDILKIKEKPTSSRVYLLKPFVYLCSRVCFSQVVISNFPGEIARLCNEAEGDASGEDIGDWTGELRGDGVVPDLVNTYLK